MKKISKNQVNKASLGICLTFNFVQQRRFVVKTKWQGLKFRLICHLIDKSLLRDEETKIREKFDPIPPLVATMAQFSTHSSVSVRCKRAPWLSPDPALKLWWWWWKFTLDWWHVEQLSKDTNDGQLTSTLKNFGVSNHLFQTMKNWKWNSNKSMVWWRRFANSHHKK